MVTNLSAPQMDLLLRVADVLIPATALMPSLRTADPDGQWLRRAYFARQDVLPALTDALDQLAESDDLPSALQTFHRDSRNTFDVVANVVAGAYYLIPEVRTLLGYPGQVRNPAPLDLAGEELSDEVFEGAMNYPGTHRPAPA
jgi:hypothetical protein